MARIEKTVFISYRRKDISWALAVYQYLTSQRYDVFFDFSSIPSGDFEQIIIGNIKARAHFVLILTPTAMDRCSEPGDWLRREIETAIDEKRNIIPLFFDGFSFGSPAVAEKLAGNFSTIKRYNGLDIPSGYFMEAMERLHGRYLNVPLNAVIHPVSTEVRKVVKEEQIAVNKALAQKWEDIKEILKPAEEKPVTPKQVQTKKTTDSPSPIRRRVRGEIAWRPYGIGAGILLLATLGIFGINSLIQNAVGNKTPLATQTKSEIVDELIYTPTPTLTVATSTATIPPFTPTSEYSIGSTITSPKDSMVMVYVPASEFIMGSEAGDADEKPIHTVYLDAYWIDQTEVTIQMYSYCVEAGFCVEPTSKASYTRSSYFGDNDFKDHPVIFVDWTMATTYCEWVDRRLPTEAEWEKAASWDDATNKKHIYPWGTDSPNDNLLNYNNAARDTTEVGIYPDGASHYGAFDMAGNVWEWVNDWYDPNYYEKSPSSNPQGPDSGQYRVIRGGSFSLGGDDVRSAYRVKLVTANTGFTIGFRCALSE